MAEVKALKLSRETLALVRQHKLPFSDWKDTSTPANDGMLLVPIEDSTAERLETLRFPGETDDDLVVRVISALHGKQ